MAYESKSISELANRYYSSANADTDADAEDIGAVDSRGNAYYVFPWGSDAHTHVEITAENVQWELLQTLVGASKCRSKQSSDVPLYDRLKHERDELATAIAVLARKLARREEQVKHLERYPTTDEFADGTILRFTKTFPDGDQCYPYIALKTQDLWYLTGKRSPQGITWQKLVEFMGLGVNEVYCVNAAGTDGEQKVIG